MAKKVKTPEFRYSGGLGWFLSRKIAGPVAEFGVYYPGRADRAELCHPVAKGGFITIRDLIDGTPRLATWEPMQMKLIRKDGRKVLTQSDSPYGVSSALVFTARAIDAMEPMLTQHGELLPLACEDAELWMYNPTIRLDALDQTLSEINRIGESRQLDIISYVFREEVIRGVDVFKLPIEQSGMTFVSASFVNRWNAAGLRGLKFKKFWPELN